MLTIWHICVFTAFSQTTFDALSCTTSHRMGVGLNGILFYTMLYSLFPERPSTITKQCTKCSKQLKHLDNFVLMQTVRQRKLPSHPTVHLNWIYASSAHRYKDLFHITSW